MVDSINRAAVRIHPARKEREVRGAARLMRGLVASNERRYRDRKDMIEDYYRDAWFLADEPEVPAAYRPPDGDVLVAYLDALAVGTVAFRRMDRIYCELRSMFVPAAHRGKGIAASLCHEALAIARAQGYRGVRLTTGERQPEAHGLYLKLGFKPVPPWDATPPDGVNYLELALGSE